jgi:hypothetical protein
MLNAGSLSELRLADSYHQLKAGLFICLRLLNMRLKRRNIVLLVLILSSSLIKSQINESYTFKLKIDASLWIPEKTWTLIRSSDWCSLDNTRYNFTLQDSVLKNYFYHFDSILSKYKFLTLGNIIHKDSVTDAFCVDGTHFYGDFLMNETHKTFDFHCCNIAVDPYQYMIIDDFYNIIFYLYNKTSFRDSINTKDIDTLEKFEYNSYNDKLRLVSTKPDYYRMPGNMYSETFYESLPKNKIVIIEVGNYTLFHHRKMDEEMKLRNQKNLIWIILNKNKNRLLDIGIKKKYIYNSFESYKKKKNNWW